MAEAKGERLLSGVPPFWRGLLTPIEPSNQPISKVHKINRLTLGAIVNYIFLKLPLGYSKLP